MESEFGEVSIKVIGATPKSLNGIYEKDGTLNGVGRHSKNAEHLDCNVKFCIYQYTSADKTMKEWRISQTRPFGVENTWMFSSLSTEHIFYTALPSKDNPDYPPSRGWMTRDSTRDLLVMLERIEATSRNVSEITQKILFSEKFCDIRFVCGDGVIVHAHRIILAESSSYFDTAFNGPWTENDSGEWKTSHPSHAIKAMLTLLYTGRNDFDLIDEDPLASISVASEYGLPDLKSLAASRTARLVKESNVKDMLQAAHLYDSAMLMNVCVDFVKNNPLSVLAHSDISSLKTEAPDLWDEFIKAIAP